METVLEKNRPSYLMSVSGNSELLSMSYRKKVLINLRHSKKRVMPEHQPKLVMSYFIYFADEKTEALRVENFLFPHISLPIGTHKEVDHFGAVHPSFH